MEEPVMEPTGDSESDFALSLAALTQSLQALQTRYDEVQSHRAKQQQLDEHRADLEAQWQTEQRPALEQELQQLTEQLTELSLQLESELLTDKQLQKIFWDGLRQGLMGDIFWQIVRFGGLGIVVGWLLKSWQVGGN
jgi:small-conductance mechanosensitive channel